MQTVALKSYNILDSVWEEAPFHNVHSGRILRASVRRHSLKNMHKRQSFHFHLLQGENVPKVCSLSVLFYLHIPVISVTADTANPEVIQRWSWERVTASRLLTFPTPSRPPAACSTGIKAGKKWGRLLRGQCEGAGQTAKQKKVGEGGSNSEVKCSLWFLHHKEVEEK